jgi:tRNA pseudouridine(55) synthase
MEGDKVYSFEISLGTETDTLDGSGRVVATLPWPSDICEARIEAVLTSFRGEILQVPPAYSALKHEGRPLYEYMRTQGHLTFDIETKARRVTIKSLISRTTEASLKEGRLLLEVRCTKGTYVRSLARDVARSLGTVGHCSALRRLEVGSFKARDAVVLDAADIKASVAELRRVSAQLQDALMTIEDVFGSKGLGHAFVSVPATNTLMRDRINAGNRVPLEKASLADWLGAATADQITTEPDSPWHGFVRTPESLFWARIRGERTTPTDETLCAVVEPLKLIESTAAAVAVPH